MSKRASLRRWSRKLDPLGQGDLDYLCGIYASINAIRLVYAPTARLLEREDSLLFKLAVEELAARGKLAPAMVSGMEAAALFPVLERLVRSIRPRSKRRLTIIRPRHRHDTGDLLSFIQLHLDRAEPAIVRVKGAWQHWSVITAITSRKVFLFDSYGRRHIRLSELSVDAQREPARFHIVRTGVFILSWSDQATARLVVEAPTPSSSEPDRSGPNSRA